MHERYIYMNEISKNSYLNIVSQNIDFSHFLGLCCERVLMLPLSEIVRMLCIRFWYLALRLLSFLTLFFFLYLGPNQDTSGSPCGHQSMLTLIAGSSGQSTGLTTKQLGYTSMILKGPWYGSASFLFFLGPREACTCTPWHIHLVENQCPFAFLS